MVADAMVKAADVRLIGIESTGNEKLQIRVEGGVAAVLAALQSAEERAQQLGTDAVTRCLPHPEPGLQTILRFPNAQNPLYGGRDQLLPTDYPQTSRSLMNGNE